MLRARERRREVRTILIKLICEKCECEILPTGECLTSYPAQYLHKCTGCGLTTHIAGKTYPYLDYEEIN